MALGVQTNILADNQGDKKKDEKKDEEEEEEEKEEEEKFTVEQIQFSEYVNPSNGDTLKNKPRVLI